MTGLIGCWRLFRETRSCSVLCLAGNGAHTRKQTSEGFQVCQGIGIAVSRQTRGLDMYTVQGSWWIQMLFGSCDQLRQILPVPPLLPASDGCLVLEELWLVFNPACCMIEASSWSSRLDWATWCVSSGFGRVKFPRYLLLPPNLPFQICCWSRSWMRIVMWVCRRLSCLLHARGKSDGCSGHGL